MTAVQLSARKRRREGGEDRGSRSGVVVVTDTATLTREGGGGHLTMTHTPKVCENAESDGVREKMPPDAWHRALQD